jgi:hypothetical protein
LFDIRFRVWFSSYEGIVRSEWRGILWTDVELGGERDAVWAVMEGAVHQGWSLSTEGGTLAPGVRYPDDRKRPNLSGCIKKQCVLSKPAYPYEKVGSSDDDFDDGAESLMSRMSLMTYENGP